MNERHEVTWQLAEVYSPSKGLAISVIAAKDIPYKSNANRMQNLNIYLPKTEKTEKLVGTSATSLPVSSTEPTLPQTQVHIHGGAWRDPVLTSISIEATVAHTFSAKDVTNPITAIVSMNYTLSPFPTHPTMPYDPTKGDNSDPAREGYHPMNISDVLHGFDLLRLMGLTDGSYILTGHSAGACLSCQATLQSPAHWGVEDVADPPRPAAFLGLNGLYHLPELVHGLGPKHENLKDVYEDFLSITFDKDQTKWPAASPAQFDLAEISKRVQEGKAPQFVVLDQSTEDQLVPMNQMETMKAHLEQVGEMKVVQGQRNTGLHAAPWLEGLMIWEGVQDVLKMLKDDE